MRRGELIGRIEPNFYLPSTTGLSNSKFPRTILGELSLRIIQPTEFTREYMDDSENSLPVLRAANIGDGELNLVDLVFVDKEKLQSAQNSFIEKGDILITRTGAKAGETCVVRELPRQFVVSSHSIRVIPNKDIVEPEFLENALLSRFGKDQVNRLLTGAAQKQLQLKSVATIQIPLPPLNIQRALVADMESARLARQAKLSQADELLKGIDGFVLGQLGIKLPKEENTRKSFATRLKQLQTNLTMNADYFHPERMEALKVIQKSSPRLRVERLADIADFLRDIATVQEDDNYLGLASVQSNTGELVQVEETADGQCFRYQKNDVLFGRLRPYLNKVRCAEEDGVCSTEFHVIRLRKEEKSKEEISSEYLAVILRSSVILAQTKHMMTGNTHPRLTNEDVVSLVVPIPKDINLQKKIVSELQRRRAQARALRESAEREWQKAKEKFEKALLG